jgi:hypothetical protein
VKRTIILYSLALAALVFLLKFLEYRFIIRDLSLEFYFGIIAILFTALGIWAGLKLTRKKIVIAGPEFILNESELQKLGYQQTRVGSTRIDFTRVI